MLDHIRKLRFLLSARDQRHALVLLGLMALGALLEMAGVGVIPAFVALLNSPEEVASHPLARAWAAAVGVHAPEGLVLSAALGLIVLYLGKNAYLAGLSYLQARFVADLQVGLARRLFAAYLYAPYTFHLQRNTAELIRNTNQVAFEVIGAGLLPLLRLTLHVLTVAAILGLLLWVEPLISLAAFAVLGGASYLFLRFLRGRTVELGERMHQHHGRMIQAVNEGLGSSKVTRVLGRESHFLQVFGGHAGGYATSTRFQQVINEVPRLFLETAAILGILGVAAAFVAGGRDLRGILPVLSLLAVGVVRMIPSFNQITNALNGLRYGRAPLDIVHADLRRLAAAPPRKGSEIEPLRFRTSIRLDRVTYRYPGAAEPSLEEVSLEIPRGSTVGLVGATGAGKTTLVDVVMGLLAPDGGAVRVDGVDIREREADWQRLIGYVPQDTYLVDDTIRRNIAFGLPEGEIDEEAVRRAAEAAQVAEFADRLPIGLDTVVGERGVRLSGGQRQRIGIARALYGDPSVLVLDEATSALDTDTEREVMEAVERLRGERTILLIAHRASTVQSCDLVARLSRGRLVLERVPTPAVR